MFQLFTFKPVNDDLEFDFRLFLRSYSDAIQCLQYFCSLDQVRQCAAHDHNNKQYINKADYLIRVQRTPNYLQDREVRLFQFSSLIFKRYLQNSDFQNHEFDVYQIIFSKALQLMHSDLVILSS